MLFLNINEAEHKELISSFEIFAENINKSFDREKVEINTLEEDLIADFYIWANRREKIYANWPKMEYNFTKQTILRWYGAKVKKDANCTVCGLTTQISDKDNIFKKCCTK